MNLKRIKYTTLFISFTLACPLLAYSENTGKTHNDKNPFMIAVNKKKPLKNVQKSQGLSGSWLSQDGTTSLVFFPSNQLEFNGERGNYKLVPGAIQLEDQGEKIDYKYILNGNSLLINFPEGYTIQFQRVGGQSGDQYSQNKGNQKVKSGKKSTNCNNIKVLQAEVSGGCNITLITPRQCEEIDLSNGRSYQFAWQTGGTLCETPYKLYVAGNPYSEQNVLSWQFSTKVGEISQTGGGFTNVTAQDLAGLTSVDGVYSWVVYGWYGSHPASQNFRVRM